MTQAKLEQALSETPTTPGEKLIWMSNYCVSVWLNSNDQRGAYDSAAHAVEYEYSGYDNNDERNIRIALQCIDHNSFHEMTVYPFTPVSFCKSFHWDLDQLIDEIYAEAREHWESMASNNRGEGDFFPWTIGLGSESE